METRGTTMRKIALMDVGPDEVEAMQGLDTVWAQTMDMQHENILAYPIDIMVEHVEELYPLKYIDRSDFMPYEAENGSHWLISNSLNVADIDSFFRLYLHLEEEVA